MPIRTVLITALSKYDGQRTRHLSVREFLQVAGRAGRAGFDTAGTVVVQAPDHVVENVKATAKAGEDPKKLRKLVKRKPPEGFVSWGEPTFDRLVGGEPEQLTSSFAVSHAMLLNVIARPGDPFTALRRLLEDNHEPRAAQLRHLRHAIAIYRALVAGEVVQRLEEPEPDGRQVRLTVALQPDFALNQPLSPFAVAALDLLDRAAPTYPLDVLSVLEATLEDPRQVISAQRFKARGEAVAAMKAEGIEYDERMELLEEVTYPRPLEDLLEPAFEQFRSTQPWVGDSALSPKSIARDLSERYMTFSEYVSFYGLARSEGLLLRYLADAYKALRRVVPDDARTEEVGDLQEWLGELVRQTDSSLLDEWERLSDPALVAAGPPQIAAPPPSVTRNPRAFRVLVRNALFRRVELVALRRWIDLAELDADVPGGGLPQDAWEAGVRAYFEEHETLGTGPDARSSAYLQVHEEPGRWLVRQVLDDPEGDRDWGITAVVDLTASNAEGVAVVRPVAVGRVDGDWRDQVPADD